MVSLLYFVINRIMVLIEVLIFFFNGKMKILNNYIELFLIEINWVSLMDVVNFFRRKFIFNVK